MVYSSETKSILCDIYGTKIYYVIYMNEMVYCSETIYYVIYMERRVSL